MAIEPTRARGKEAGSPVVDLARAREARRLKDLAGRCRVGDELNRKSLASLFQSGLLYTRQGARLGRDLLLAHQLTLRVWELLARMDAQPEAAPADESERMYREAQLLLSRVSELTARSEVVLARR